MRIKKEIQLKYYTGKTKEKRSVVAVDVKKEKVIVEGLNLTKSI